MRKFKHVIQARITATKEKHWCKCGRRAVFLYTCYEPHSPEDKAHVQQEANKFIRKYGPFEVFDFQEALMHNKTLLVHDKIYRATLKEQQEGPPVEHMRDCDCFTCAAVSLPTEEMGLPNSEELLTRLERAGHEHALWIIRDVSRPDRWAVTMSPHHDAAKLQEELYTHSFTIGLMENNG